MSKTKLELTWIGKDKRPKLEPRILLENPALSYYAKFRRHPVGANKFAPTPYFLILIFPSLIRHPRKPFRLQTLLLLQNFG
ncbi:MAG: hypothetical protein HOP34_01460 [Methylococcaceae bacterium]|nr:hypothetical protein [Methylococcaceae bacterium]